MDLQKKLEESVHFIREKAPNFRPRVGVILGSGLGSFALKVESAARIPYREIPHFVPPTVEGHNGELFLGQIETVPVAILQGRIHFYEGLSMEQVVFPARALAMLGIEYLILTNAAGGLNPEMKPGDFMIISDHVNLMGDNPLKGPNLVNLGPRFPDMTEAYDRQLIKKLEDLFTKLNMRHSQGVYCGVSGPTYETPAEVRYLQQIGGDAVGMSTIPESIAANHLGIKVAGISCITNLAAGITKTKLVHSEVMETAKKVDAQFTRFLFEFIKTF